ncbi:uncharacterized protein LOC128193770 [Vigna angularis]|uniref:uncharacterized protein LOC128193770 n=1 Tax=Phaseolus angularis TaxID=3914 RepID=UPI0022B4730E|nr:uncharacterized protein LOC128193770 [Vigna angularis]
MGHQQKQSGIYGFHNMPKDKKETSEFVKILGSKVILSFMLIYNCHLCPLLTCFIYFSWSTRKIFAVNHTSTIGNNFTLDLDTKQCSCRKWIISVIPCCHAIATMNYSNLDLENFIPTCFRRSTYEEAYASIIFPLNGHLLWERTTFPDLLPPVKRKLLGRPKKKRRLEAWELTNDDTQMRVGGHRKKCSICRQRGHNKNNCPLCPQPAETIEAMDETQPSQAPPTTQSPLPSQLPSPQSTHPPMSRTKLHDRRKATYMIWIYYVLCLRTLFLYFDDDVMWFMNFN